jgi:hypothetical protein
MDKRVEIESLEGMTIEAIIINTSKTKMDLIMANDEVYRFMHKQDCCEEVYLADVIGDLADIIGFPLVRCYETSNKSSEYINLPLKSFTWTFYTLRTLKGTVTLRWYGHSNGYYSEEVDLFKISGGYMYECIYPKT